MFRIALLLLALSAPLYSMSPARAETLTNPAAYQVDLLYRALAGEEPDYESVARNGPAFRQASEFDRSSVLANEIRRLRAEYQRMGQVDELVVNVNGSFSEYDSVTGGFNLDLFRPDVFIPFGTTSIRFDNHSDFATWKLDVPGARAALASNQNGRGVVYRVHMRPVSTQANPRSIKVQATRVVLLNGRTNASMAELTTAQPLRDIQRPGAAMIARIDPAKLAIMGLAIGASPADHAAWLAARNLVGEAFMLRQTAQREIITAMFATHKEPYAALGGGREVVEHGRFTRRDLEPSPSIGFGLGGERLDCKSRARLDSICGSVSFTQGGGQPSNVAAMRVLQNIASSSIQPVLAEVVARYGNYAEAIDVTLNGMPGKQYVWGPPLALNPERHGLADYARQGRAWQLSAILVQAEPNRVALLIQVGAGPEPATPGSTAADRPRL